VVSAALVLGAGGAAAQVPQEVPEQTPEEAPPQIPGEVPAAGALPGQPAPEPLEEGLPRERVIVPSFGVTERFTDNVLLQPRGRSDEITTLSPGAIVRYHRRLLDLSLDSTLDIARYAENGSLNQLRPFATGTGQARIVPEYLAVDVRTFATVQQTNRQFAIQSDVANGAPGQQTVYGYTLSPFLDHRFGSLANTELRYLYGQTFVSTPNGATAPTPGLGVSNSTLNDASTFIETGSSFTRLLSRASADASTTSLPQGDFVHRNVDLGTQYALSRPLSVLSTFGYDDIQAPLLVQPLSSAYFLGGLQLVPGPRTKLRFQIGERYRDLSMIGEATYRLGEQSTARLSYTDRVSSQPTEFLTNLDNVSQDPFGNLVNRQTGLTFTPREQAALNLTNQPFRERLLTATVPVVDGRNTYTLIASQTSRQFLTLPGIGLAPQPSQTARVVTLTFARQVTPFVTATASASYQMSSIGSVQGSDIDSLRFQTGLDYRYSEATTFQAIFSYLDQSLGAAVAAAVPGQSGTVREASVLVGVRRRF
jgi:uncharacterized protein (PEP-CTERM system associated)